MTVIVGYELGGMTDPSAVGTVLRQQAPAIACLLGVRSPRRLRGVLADAGMSIAARGGARGAASVVAVREGARLRAVTRVPLSTERSAPEREAVHAIVGVDGLGLSVTAVQLGLRPDVRRRHVDELLAFLGTIEPAAIVVASLSEPASGPAARALAESYLDAFAVAGSGQGDTYPVDEPVARHDFVFVDRRLHVTSAHVPSDPAVLAAARHRPVVVDVVARDTTSSGGLRA